MTRNLLLVQNFQSRYTESDREERADLLKGKEKEKKGITDEI